MLNGITVTPAAGVPIPRAFNVPNEVATLAPTTVIGIPPGAWTISKSVLAQPQGANAVRTRTMRAAFEDTPFLVHTFAPGFATAKVVGSVSSFALALIIPIHKTRLR